MSARFLILALLIAVFQFPVCVADELRSDFESPSDHSDRIDGIWRRDKLAPGAFEVQDKFVRSGAKAARLTVRAGQIERTGKDGEATERAELQLDTPWWTREGERRVYEFSVYVPQDFPIDLKRVVIAQWKQVCPGEHCKIDNPVLSVRIREDRLSIVRVGDTGESEELYRLKGLKKNALGKWLDFRFELKFARGKNGSIRASLNGKEVVNRKGPTAYSAAAGYPADPAQFDFRMGLYRDRDPRSLSLIFDRFRRTP